MQPALQEAPRRSRGVLGPSLADNRPKTDPEIENRESAECRCVNKKVVGGAPDLSGVAGEPTEPAGLKNITMAAYRWPDLSTQLYVSLPSLKIGNNNYNFIFVAGVRPNLAPRPAPTGRARKMV